MMGDGRHKASTARRLARAVVVVATAAGVLVPALGAPARTILVPKTLAGALSLGAPGSVPFTFPATHLAFTWEGEEGTGIEFRTLGPGGPGEWTEAAEWHDAEREERHFSGVYAIERAAHVEWRPLEPTGMEVSGARVIYMNTLDGPRERVQIPSTAEAATQTPTIVTRAQWGADESLKRTSGGCKRSFAPVQQLFVHHTAGSNTDTDSAATMRAIYRYHTRSLGWCDIGYNFVIGRDGHIYEGRWARFYAPFEVHTGESIDGKAVIGAHTAGFNTGSVGISLMGNFQDSGVPARMRSALVGMLAWEADRHSLNPTGTHTYTNPSGTRKRLPFIAGHRDAGQTACPGTRLYNALGSIRTSVAETMGTGKQSTSATLTVAKPTIVIGQRTLVSGSLAGPEGAGLANKEILMYRRRGKAWDVAARLTTASDGTFRRRFKPSRTIVLRAVYEGDESTWDTQSANRRIKVAHAVTLSPQGGKRSGGVTVYPPGTATVLLTGTAGPVHGNAAVTVRVFRRTANGTFRRVVSASKPIAPDGTFKHRFRRSKPGTYRAVARYARDGLHAGSRSTNVNFRIESP